MVCQLNVIVYRVVVLGFQWLAVRSLLTVRVLKTRACANQKNLFHFELRQYDALAAVEVHRSRNNAKHEDTCHDASDDDADDTPDAQLYGLSRIGVGRAARR